MSAIIQGKQMLSDKAVPLAPLSRAAETAPSNCLLVTWTKDGQQYPVFQKEEDSLGLTWNAA